MRVPFLAWTLVAFGLIYAFFIGGAPAGMGLSQLRLVSAVLIAAALAAWAIAILRGQGLAPRSVFLPALVACVVSMGVSTVTSRSPRVSVEYLSFAVLVAALYLLLVRLMALPYFRDRILGVAAGTGVVITCLFLGAVAMSWAQFWTLVGRITPPPLRPAYESLVFANPSPLLAMVVLLGAVTVGLVANGRRSNKALIAACVLFFGAAALLTGTRGGWFGIAVGTVTLLIAVAFTGGLQPLLVSGRRLTARIGPIGLAFSGVLVVGLAAVLVPAALRRVAAGNDNRTVFYRIAVQLFSEAPIAGVGPGMWAAERIAYTLPDEVDEYVPHAHDLYLQGLAEMGVVGLAAGLLTAITLLWLLRDGLRDTKPFRRRWALVATFTTGYFIGHHFVDFLVNIPAVIVAFAIPIALLDATAERRPGFLPARSSRFASRATYAAGGLAVASALALAISVEVFGLRHAEAVALANEGRWAEARDPATSAAEADPDMPVYRLTAGLAAAHAGDYAAAAAEFRVVAEADDLPEAWIDLADAYAHLGDARAKDALGKALRLGIQQPAVSVPAVEIALDLGEHQLAVDALAGALISNASLAADPWWRAEPSRQAAFDEAYDRVVAGGSQRAWQVAMYAGDLEESATIAARLPAEQARVASLVVAAWGGDATAYASLVERCIADPLDPTLGWCRFVSAHQSDSEALQRFSGIARLVSIGGGPSDELQIVDSGVGNDTAGNTAFLYGVLTYRRFTPWDMLSPSLVHLAKR